KREQFNELVLHAQTHALAFYTKHGFQIEGDEFLEAGIPHYRMRLKL
ncbi:MAG: GNAT family N-acetyltransferase, partial [Burkholderiaceae bacterium]